jgi:hypothetical protein
LAGGAAAAGIAGGALLKRQLTPERRKVLGVSLPPKPKLNRLVPSGGLELKPIAKQVSKSGKRATKASAQLSKLSDDVERVGNACRG